MCIVLVTTAHPSYPLIILDNRDEFILRPTSRPHWWTHGASGQQVLSSRDLQREEMGTWLGITREGKFAVLTNYRETDVQNEAHPVHGLKSRGGIVTAWLCNGIQADNAKDFVRRMLEGGGVKGVGGFSLMCGRLQKRKAEDGAEAIEPLAILSNRNEHPDQVQWVAGHPGDVWGLSNTCYDSVDEWPKVARGKKLVKEAVAGAVEGKLGEHDLLGRLFAVLDTDSLPKHADMKFEDYISELKQSIFIPPVGDAAHKAAMEKAVAEGLAGAQMEGAQEVPAEIRGAERPSEQPMGFETGMYGTQRQTVILVDWDGNVTYAERALWDKNGSPVERGTGDEIFKFKIEGWEDRIAGELNGVSGR